MCWIQKAEISYFVRRMSTLWFEESKGEERQFPPHTPPVKHVALQKAFWYVFTYLWQHHMSILASQYDVNVLWVPISHWQYSVPLYQGWSATPDVMVCCLFRLPPKRWTISSVDGHLLSTFRPGGWCTVGSYLYLPCLAGSTAVFSLTWIDDWSITHNKVAALLFCLKVSIHKWEWVWIWLLLLMCSIKQMHKLYIGIINSPWNWR